jgi:hypothetical protein
MTLASTTAAAAALPPQPQWGVGRYDSAGEPVYFEVSWADQRRDAAWARAVLADHGVGADSGLVIVCGMAESPWFDPFETAARELGAPYSTGEVFGFEAFRTGMYAHRLPITMIFGINAVVAEGLADELAEIVAKVPVIVARPDAAGPLAEAGARPFIATQVGPAIAVECPHRSGAHINSAEWSLTERDGELFISTAGPRAYQVTEAATGLAGSITAEPCACGRGGQRVTITEPGA